MANKTEARDTLDLSTTGVRGDFATLPDGYGIHDLEGFGDIPRRARGNYTFREVASLGAYLTRYGDANAVAFADWRARTIMAVLDYHEPNGSPAFGEHRARFVAQRTSDWDAWRAANDKPQGQVAFGRFLEENARVIVEPDAANIVEVCMNLDAVKRVTFQSAVRLSDGYRQIKYVEENDTKGGIRVPEAFVINVAVFEGQEPQRIPIRLRYRIDEGKLAMWVTIDNLDETERLAFERCVDGLSLDGPDGLPVYRAIL